MVLLSRLSSSVDLVSTGAVNSSRARSVSRVARTLSSPSTSPGKTLSSTSTVVGSMKLVFMYIQAGFFVQKEYYAVVCKFYNILSVYGSAIANIAGEF